MNTAEQIQERRAEGEDRSPVILDKSERKLIHESEYLIEFLRDLQKRMCCMEDIAVLDEEIDKFMECCGRSK